MQSCAVVLLRCDVLFAGHGVRISAKQKKPAPHSRHWLSYLKNPGRHVQSELAAAPAGELLCSGHPSLRPWPGQKAFAAQGVHPEWLEPSAREPSKPGAHTQCSGSVDAGGECVPAGHSAQARCPLPLLYLPGVHAVQGSVSPGVYPASHSQGAPGASVPVLAGQGRHAFRCASWRGGQGWHPESESARPAGHKHASTALAPVPAVWAPGGQGTHELFPTKDL